MKSLPFVLAILIIFIYLLLVNTSEMTAIQTIQQENYFDIKIFFY